MLRLDIGEDAQIRAKRGFIVFVSLCVVTAVLDLNINGKVEKVVRGLKKDEIYKSDVIIKPVQHRKTMKKFKKVKSEL